MLDFNQLKEFNTALVYSFTPEKVSEQETVDTALIPGASQIQDMFEGYLFAQNTILVKLKENEGFINKEEFLEVINNLHLRIGKTLMECIGGTSGIYTTQSVFRWHNGTGISDNIAPYLVGLHRLKNERDFIKYLVEEFNLEEEAVRVLLGILKKLKSDTTLHLNPRQLENLKLIPEKFHQGAMALEKLQLAYFSRRFNTRERESIEKIVKICLPPHEIPAAMDHFAQRTLERLSQCDKTDDKNIADFLATTFYELTDIHPFANANGRVATCIMNIFLRYFDLPSILLRYPGEKEDAASAYSIAIAEIDRSRVPLQTLIFDRIQQARINPFENQLLRETVLLRVEIKDIVLRIKQKAPNFDSDTIRTEIIADKEFITQAESITNIELMSLFFVKKMHQLAQNEERRIDLCLQHRSKPVTTGFGLSVFTEELRQKQISNLTALTGISNWRISHRNGITTAWIECTDDSQARSLFEKMESLKISTNKLARRADNKAIWVVRCERLDSQKLTQLVEAISSNEVDQTASLGAVTL